ncbi:carbohydrate ABC transporter permease [Paenibacillus sp. IB182496]|uniref:Carbohydrate ABC transporter permease n=1 Tax=Paenibacillus sabuli TaxID=2772509 RepID=A0A927BZ21_9BACL|nr:carbohydrate ABC transporter permease [Paenibacillus sabuli]MBD2848119.1 carbohydrate ABC transporter permease [Paenibacillus sabuli]
MIKESLADRLLKGAFAGCLTLFAVYCILPFVAVIGNSLTTERSIRLHGFTLFPREWTTLAYQFIFSDSTIFRAYGVTIFVTVVGTALAMLATCALAYPLSLRALKYRNAINFYVYFTMLFNGGLVASYLLIAKYLGMKDTIWVLIIPALINPWNMFLLRNFFKSIDESLAESAKIDGADDIYIMFRIILPISLPALSTIGLFYAIAFWNKWFEALLYISDERLYPLQYLIQRIMSNLQFAEQLQAKGLFVDIETPTLTVNLATTVVTIGPIIFLYPFLQKYFVKGLMVGAVKG